MPPAPAADFPRTFPSSLVTPTGTISYWIDPYSYSETFANAGATSKCKLYVQGTDTPDFVKYAIGFTQRLTGSSLGSGGGGGSTVTLSRQTPLPNPFFTTGSQYLNQLSMVAAGKHTNDPSFDNWPDWAWVEYEATFSTKNFTVLSDADTPSAGGGLLNELARYVTRMSRPAARERKVPGFALETVETPPQQIPEVGFVTDRSVDWVYTWHQVPMQSYPFVNVANQINTVNNATFDVFAGTASLDGTQLGTPFPTGTLLFRNMGRELEPYRGRDGGAYYDVVYLFTYRPAGWNNYFRPDGTTVAWRYKRAAGTSGPDIPPYQSSDLTKLFQPI